MNHQDVEILLKSAEDKDGNVRKATAIALKGAEDSPYAKNALIKMLKDKVWQVRESAITSLGALRVSEAGDYLMGVLLAEDEGSARKAILTWAVAKGDPAAANEKKPGAVPGLGGSAPKPKKEGEPWQIKKAAALALSRIRPDIAAEPLMGALGTDNVPAKTASMIGLANINAEEAIDPIIEILGSEDSNLRKVAATTLGRLKAVTATEKLIGLLEDEKQYVRIEAVIALNHIKPPEALEALGKMFESEASYEVRKVCATALGNLRDPAAMEPLSKALKDSNWMVQKAAVDALINLRNPDVIAILSPVLTDEHEEVRGSAAVGIIRLSTLA